MLDFSLPLLTAVLVVTSNHVTISCQAAGRNPMFTLILWRWLLPAEMVYSMGKKSMRPISSIPQQLEK